MAHERQASTLEARKDPHPVSLKVLRLSPPSLATQYALPQRTSAEIPEIPDAAALSYPSADPHDHFILSPLLTLPPAFGSAYVGETFACTVCANNERRPNDGASTVHGVRIAAEMQTPATTAALDLGSSISPVDHATATSLLPGQTLQKLVRFDLKDPGNHVLAITVTYHEGGGDEQHDVTSAGPSPPRERVRTFRKLYQFLAEPSLAVRTKTVELNAGSRADAVPDAAPRYLLEAQLENMSQDLMTLETVDLMARPPLQSTSLNWDVPWPSNVEPKALKQMPPPTLSPREILQVAFLVESNSDTGEDESPPQQLTSPPPALRDGRMALGQLRLEWRTAMGERGVLSTGWLTFRKR